MKEKRMDFEVLRIIAIFFVIFNHTQSRGFELYMLPNVSGVNYYGSLTLGILCKTAVPLFLLVSGGLLLQRQEPIRVVLKKRAGRMAAVLVLFSAVLYGFWCAWGYVEHPGVCDFLKRLWGSGISRPYWYLYAFLGLMLLLPLLRPMAEHMETAAFWYLMALHLVFQGCAYLLGLFSPLGPLKGDLIPALGEPVLFYFLMGYFLAHRLDWEKVRGKQLLGLWVLAVLTVILNCILLGIDLRRNGGQSMSLLKGFMLFPVMAVYATVNRMSAWHPPKQRLSRVIGTLGSCTFGAYLLEGILRHHLGFLYEALEPKIHVLPACLVWVAAVGIAGMAITFILKKLPVLRKLL